MGESQEGFLYANGKAAQNFEYLSVLPLLSNDFS